MKGKEGGGGKNRKRKENLGVTRGKTSFDLITKFLEDFVRSMGKGIYFKEWKNASKTKQR